MEDKLRIGARGWTGFVGSTLMVLLETRQVQFVKPPVRRVVIVVCGRAGGELRKLLTSFGLDMFEVGKI